MQFKEVKKSYTKKRKLMLYIEKDVCDQLDDMEPHTITIQEKVRQIVKNFLDDDGMGGL